MPVTEYLGVRLNLNNPEDRRIYNKLQGCPKGERSEIMKEALLQYLNDSGTDGEKGRQPKKQKVKEGIQTPKDSQEVLDMDYIRRAVLKITEQVMRQYFFDGIIGKQEFGDYCRLCSMRTAHVMSKNRKEI